MIRKNWYLTSCGFFLGLLLQYAVAYCGPGDSTNNSTDGVLFRNATYNFVDETFKFTTWNTEDADMYDFEPAYMRDTLNIMLFDAEANCQFIFPIKSTRVTSGFGPRRLWSKHFHYGLDIDLETGDTVVSALDGVVRVTRYERGYGYFVVVSHNNGLETLYGHLSSFIAKPGQEVKAGDPIGRGGSTGLSTGAHLHFEFRFMGEQFDPARIISFRNSEVITSAFKLDAKWFRHLTSPYKQPTYTHTHKNSKSQVYKNNGVQKTTPGGKGSGGSVYYAVKKGDSLGGIAKMYGTSVQNLCTLNNVHSLTILQIGQRLVVK